MAKTSDDVQQFLTQARGRVTPEAAGLTWFSGERRVPGLRREEVAQLAGVSTAYYTRMERGDLSGVSEGVLFAVARALQLNEAERQHLFDLAKVTSGPRRTPRARPRPTVSARVGQLVEAMRDVPVIALSRTGDPVASNQLGRALFPDLFPAGEEPLNHTRYLFLDERSRTFYPHWETSARSAVASLRLIAGQDPTDRTVAALIGELTTRSPEFHAWWGEHNVRLHRSGTKDIHHPIVGDLTVAYESLEVSSIPGLALVTYLAEPGSPSAQALDLLRSWAGVPASSGSALTG